MGTNEKGHQVAASPETQGKDTHFSTTAKVLQIFISGHCKKECSASRVHLKINILENACRFKKH